MIFYFKLSPAQKETIKEESYYKNSFEYKKIAASNEKKNILVNQTSIDFILNEYETLGDICLYLLIY
jgi:hypothetical protein